MFFFVFNQLPLNSKCMFLPTGSIDGASTSSGGLIISLNTPLELHSLDLNQIFLKI